MPPAINRAKLIRTHVERLEPRVAPYHVNDTLQPGFSVRVQPSGVKTYVVRYRPKGGGRGVNPRTIVIGRHPAITPEQAREIARAKLALVAAGKDPAAPDRSRLKVGQVLDAYLKHLEGTSSWLTTENNVKLHLRPPLGGLLASELRTEHVEAIVRRLRSEGKESTSGRVVRVLRAALRHSKLDPAPAAVKVPGWRKRKRVATPEELRRFFKACAQVLREEQYSPWAVYLFPLLVFTGARPNELRTAKWEEIDTARNLLIRQRHKTVNKTGAPREIELSAAARDILDVVPRVAGNPYILPGRAKGEHLKDYKRAWTRIMEVAGIKGLVPYDLRRALPSLGLGLGFGLRQLGEVLGHTHEATTAGYAWLQPSDRTRIVEAVSAQIREIAGSVLPTSDPERPRGTSDADPPE